jgi:hypothetical protein
MRSRMCPVFRADAASRRRGGRGFLSWGRLFRNTVNKPLKKPRLVTVTGKPCLSPRRACACFLGCPTVDANRLGYTVRAGWRWRTRYGGRDYAELQGSR